MIEQETSDRRPLPAVTALTAPYWDAVQQRRLAIQHCRHCDRFQHPPAPTCSTCRGTDLDWQQVSGLGRVVQSTTVWMARIKGFESTPYQCVAVELDEQPSLLVLGNYVNSSDFTECSIGRRVEVVFEPSRNGFLLPQFQPTKDNR